MSSARGFTLEYRSARRLDADHAAYLTHGGILVPTAVEHAPDPEDQVEVRIVVPHSRQFELRGKAGSYIPGRGLMVTFDDASQAEAAALDAYVTSGPFQTLRSQEGLLEEKPPEVTPFAPEAGEASAPPAAPPPRARRRRPRPASAAPSTAAPPPDAFDEDEPTNVTDAPAVAAGADDGGEPPSAGQDLDIRAPRPGETFHVFVVKYTMVTPYLEAAAAFDETRHLKVSLDVNEGTHVDQVAQLRLTLPGHNVFEMWTRLLSVASDHVELRVDADDEQYRKAVLYPTTPSARKRLEREAGKPVDAPTVIQLEQEQPKEDIDKMPIRRRLARLGMDDKINMALSGNRQERMALAMDGNKAVHHYLLKNAKITLDEIAFMARLPSLNPDVLDKIAENPAYTQNPTVTKALVYNPRTPIKTAIRLLDRLPRSEVMNLAKRTTMNQRLVMAAKKKIERRSR